MSEAYEGGEILLVLLEGERLCMALELILTVVTWGAFVTPELPVTCERATAFTLFSELKVGSCFGSCALLSIESESAVWYESTEKLELEGDVDCTPEYC